TAAGPLSASKKFEEAAACCINPVPAWKVAPPKTFANPISRSLEPSAVIFGLTILMVCVPLSLPIRDTASIGEEIFDPLITKMDITSHCAADKFIVMVWFGPTLGFRAYQSCVRKSDPVVVFVGPAIVIQLFPKLSLGLNVTPACEEEQRT